MRSLFLFLALFPALSFADTLNFEQAQRLAVERSTQISAQSSAAMANREIAISARQLPDPTLKFSLENVPVEGADRWNLTRDFMTMRRIGVMQDFVRQEKRDLRSQRADEEAERAIALKNLATANVQREAGQAWLDVWAAAQILQLTARQLNEVRLIRKLTEAAYRGRSRSGTSQTDVFSARELVGMFQDRLDEAQRKLIADRIILARWVGEVASIQSLGALPDISHTHWDGVNLETIMKQHPEITLLDQELVLAETDVHLAQAEKKSDWSLELAYSARGSAYANMVSAMVSLPLQWNQAERQDRAYAAKLALLEQRRAEREDEFRAHLAKIKVALTQWKSNRARLVRYKGFLTQQAEYRTRSALAAYRGGSGTLINALQARRAELETRSTAIQLEADTAKLWVDLEAFVAFGVENK